MLRDRAQNAYEGTIKNVSLQGVFFQAGADEHHLLRNDRCTLEIKEQEDGAAITLSCKVRSTDSVGGVGLQVVESVAAWNYLVDSLIFQDSDTSTEAGPWQTFKKRFWGGHG